MVMGKLVSLSFWTFSDSSKAWRLSNNSNLKIKEVGEVTKTKADGEEIKEVSTNQRTISLKTGTNPPISEIREVIGEEIKVGSTDNKAQALDSDIETDLGYKIFKG